MSDIPDASGDVAQAALTARVAEPVAGEGIRDATGHTHEQACLNCGTRLVGSHCHACGQAAHVHRTLGAFFHDLLHGVFHFEGKLWRTLPLLAWHPGRLTREYIDGRRASYVSPIALFLFCLFLMFAVVKQFGPDITNATDVSVNGEHIKGLEANQTELARLRGERSALIAQGKPTAAVDGKMAGREQGIAVMKELRSAGTEALAQVRTPSIRSDIPALNDALKKAQANPQLAIYKLQASAYKFAWLLIPLSVPFVWLLFAFRRRFGVYDHTVFVTYSLCFMMLLVSVGTLGAAAGITGAATAVMLLAPLHIYRQTRYAYALTRSGAAWRSVAIGVYAVVALSLFAAILVLLGAME